MSIGEMYDATFPLFNLVFGVIGFIMGAPRRMPVLGAIAGAAFNIPGLLLIFLIPPEPDDLP